MNKINSALALGDALASPDLILNLLKQLIAFGMGWFAAAWALKAFPTQPFNAKSFLGRSALAWLFAAPAGIILRAAVLGQWPILMPFVFAATAFGGLILFTWRAIYTLVKLRIGKSTLTTT